MKTAIYTRVSSSMQAEDGFSLDAQMNRLKAYCESQEWDIVGIYTDEGLSAKNTERPELQRMLRDIKSGYVNVVLVYKLDRLTRSVIDLHELLQIFDQYRVGFKSATEVFDTTTAMGRLFITIISGLAQWERENLAERTKMGQIEMTRQGRWSGGKAPFGYNYVDGQLVIDEIQAAVVRKIFDYYVSGIGSRKLLQWLNNPEHPQPAPRERWTLNALRYLLLNPIYTGHVRYGYRDITGHRQGDEMVVKGNHEAIISEEIFQRALQIRKSRRKLPPRSGTGTYAFTGLLRCSLCGSAMYGSVKYRTTKSSSPARRYYVCGERLHSGLCNMPYLPEQYLEDSLLLYLNQYVNKLESKPISKPDSNDKKRIKIENELTKLNQRRNRFMDGFADGNITSIELRQQLDRINEQEAILRTELDSLNDNSAEIDAEFVKGILQDFRSTWEIAETEQRRELLRMIVGEIIVEPDHSIKIHFVNEQV